MPFGRHWGYRSYQLFWSSVDWIYPPVCGGCGKHGFRWCPDCQSNAEKIASLPHCTCCGQAQVEGGLCAACRNDKPAFTAARAWAVFDGPVREALHRLKYGRDIGLGDALAKNLVDLLAELDWRVEMVVPVPLGIARFRDRGYNQATFLARPLALGAGLSYFPRALQKVRDTRSQVDLSYTERRANVRQAFIGKREIVNDHVVLVVDDVMTSGATLNECSAALLEAGARQVYCLTFARAVHRKGRDLQPQT